MRDQRITGFAIVSGDRHSFWAGYAAKALPPQAFEPVGVAFVTGSISAPGMVEALEHNLKKDHPLRPLYLARPARASEPRADHQHAAAPRRALGLEYAKSGDLAKARAAPNPDLAPHLSFVDMGGHGYAMVTASAPDARDRVRLHPAPDRAQRRAGRRPARYRVRHRAPLWRAGERPQLEQRVLEGDRAAVDLSALRSRRAGPRRRLSRGAVSRRKPRR